MNTVRLYLVLIAVGALATMMNLPLALLLALHGIDLGPHTDVLTAVITYLTGALAIWKRPHHAAARRLLAVGAIFVTNLVIARSLSLVAVRYGTVSWFWIGNALVTGLDNAVFCALLALFAVFPDGMYQRPYERWIVRVSWVLVPAVPLLLLLTHPTLHVNTYEVWPGPNAASASPLYIPALASLEPLGLGLYWAPAALLLLLAVGLLALRYRRFGHEQRLQIAWPLLAGLIFGLTMVVAVLSDYGLVPQSIAVILFNLTVLLLPITIAIGLLRHRLFDIEVVLRKSLVYGALWLVITLSYISLAAALGIAAGARLPVALAVLVTIIATLLFQPARRWLERLADRWVFGERLSGYELLTRFGTTLESAFDLHELIPRVATTLRRGLGVTWVRVSLQRRSGMESSQEPLGSDGIGLHDPVRPVAMAPLIHGGEHIGIIECGPKVEGQFDTKDHELLATLGRQAALAIRNARMATELAKRLDEIQRQARELAASRMRIVQAGEAERRRIERNIHDGVQQELVALLAKIRLVRNQVARDPKLGEQTLAELQENARHALEDLRELARGIHPPVLSDRGLLEALEARAARLPIGVTIDSDGVGRGTRYAQEIEGAAYFFVCEGLANVLKHAAAQQTTVRLSTAASILCIEVIDNGQGFDPANVASAGLRGLADRLEAVGGSLCVASRPQQGTILTARLPIREDTNG